jgi:hypothetical protein
MFDPQPIRDAVVCRSTGRIDPMLAPMSIRRWAAFLGAAGMFVWMLVLFYSPAVTSGDVPVTSDTATEGVVDEQRDIGCTSISDIADGEESFDWPLDDSGEPATALSVAVDVAGDLCDRFRDARSTQIGLLAVPAVVLGVFALWGPNRRHDETLHTGAAAAPTTESDGETRQPSAPTEASSGPPSSSSLSS